MTKPSVIGFTSLFTKVTFLLSLKVKPGKIEEVDWDKVMKKLDYDEKVGPVEWAKPGSKAGLK